MNFGRKIDIVYLWVDGDDAAWFKRKNEYINKHLEELSDKSYYFDLSNADKRFKNSDELKYSLRSLQKFANWINNIFIVTDNQIPKWLNVDNPRIHIVDHKEIIPKSALPTYNSVAIEHCVARIPGLQEFFIMANDDMFFGNKTHKSLFFTNSGKINWYCRDWTIETDFDNNADYIYEKSILNAAELVKPSRVDKLLDYPAHNMQGLRKSFVSECYKKYKNYIDKTINRHFRNENDIQWAIYIMYAFVHNKAKKIIVGWNNKHYITMNKKNVNSQQAFKLANESTRPNTTKSNKAHAKKHSDRKIHTLIKLKKKLWYIYEYSLVKTMYFENDQNFIDKLYAKRPNLFCLNHYPLNANKALQEQMEKLFPEKSEFEI